MVLFDAWHSQPVGLRHAEIVWEQPCLPRVHQSSQIINAKRAEQW